MSEGIEPFYIPRELADTWQLSIGEKPFMIHRRNGHWHAEIPIIGSDGRAKVHYDRIDPTSSPIKALLHFVDSPVGGAITVGVVVGVIVYLVLSRRN